VGHKGLGAILKTGLLLAHASWIGGGAKRARRAGAIAKPRKARFFCGFTAKKWAKPIYMTPKKVNAVTLRGLAVFVFLWYI
jgi:hypothetical protein